MDEGELERSSVRGGGTKDASVFDAQAASWAGEHLFASLAFGVRHAPVIDPGLRVGDADGNFVYALRFGARLARHLWLAAPLALALDAERTGAFNWFSWGSAPFPGQKAASSRQAPGRLSSRSACPKRYLEQSPSNPGVAASANLLVEGHASDAGLADAERNAVLAFGSVQRAGLRPLPLIHVPLADSWGVDAHAVGAYLPSKRGWVETYMAGVSFRD